MAQSFRQNTTTPNNNNPATVVPALPQTVQAQTMAERLFASSGYNDSIINQVSLVANSTVSFNLVNTGLTDKLMILLKGQIPFKNTAGTTQVIQLAPEFPYNMISNMSVVYNGQVTIFSASAYEALCLSVARTKAGFLQAATGAAPNQALTRVSPKKANISAGNGNLTLNAGNGLTGYSSVTVAASSTGILNFQMVLEIPFVYRHDIPLGLLALQNNSIICQVNMTSPSWLGTTALSPCFVSGGIPSTLTFDSAVATYLNATPVQYFWETPAKADLYQYFVANSYMFISVPGQKFSSTGSQALQYIMPNNYILTKLLFTLRDSTSALIDCYNNVDNPTLNYNNTTTVDKMPMAVREYLQEIWFNGTPTGLGQLLWNACQHNIDQQNLSDSSFLDLYRANNPQFFIDIGNSVSTPGTFSIAREMIVPAQVKTA